MKKDTESSAVQHKAAEGEKGAKRIIRRGRKPSVKAERETKETAAEKPKRTRTTRTTKAAREEKESVAAKADKAVAEKVRRMTEKSNQKAKGSLIGQGLKIIPLGGLAQIGMNITAFEYEDNIVVVDCGLSFPGDDMLGIDLVIPDITYLKENIDKVRGFVITHGHEDHIGALPYVLKEVNAPVYATKLTMGLIENKLKEHVMPKPVKKKVVKYGQSINLGCFRIEFIRTNHSISDAAALAIFPPV